MVIPRCANWHPRRRRRAADSTPPSRATAVWRPRKSETALAVGARRALEAAGAIGLVRNRRLELVITMLRNEPLGAGQPIGARISPDALGFLAFLWTPLDPK